MTRRKPSVLIVDDEKNTREGLARALRRHYTVHLADNGVTALELMDAEPVDALLSDIRMPGMDGMTLVRRALARTPAAGLHPAHGLRICGNSRSGHEIRRL